MRMIRQRRGSTNPFANYALPTSEAFLCPPLWQPCPPYLSQHETPATNDGAG